MKQYFNWCLIVGLACMGFKGYAQEVTVSAKLDKATILLGDQTTLRLTAVLPANGKIDFPLLSDTISSKVQFVETGKTDTLKDQHNPGKWIISRSYTITSFDAGIQTIPSFAFNSKGVQYNTDPLPLQVQSVAVDTTKAIYDIKQPLAVSYSFWDWLRDNWHWVLLGFLVIVLIGGLIYYFRKRKKDTPMPEEVKPVIPAHLVALDKLEALKERKLWQQDQVKSYYSELTDILREFIEKSYQINAMEQTSEEIFAGLKNVEFTEQNRGKLRQILMLADLVKFAKGKPLHMENGQSMEDAISFVKDAGEPKVIRNDELI